MTIDMETLRTMTPLSDAVEQTFARGMTLVRANDPSHSVYVVREGGVKEVQTTPEGKEVILALHGPGDVFGDLSEQAPATVIALMPSKVMVVPREVWLQSLDGNPPLQRTLQAQMARRLTDAWRLVRMLSRYTTEARLKSVLLILAERWGQPREEGIEIGLDLTHRTLADIAGASREKVTRALGLLQQKGLVRVVRRRLVVPSLDRLIAE